MKQISFLVLFIFSALLCRSQTLTAEESKLYDLLMAYRLENNLPKVPVSASLTFVAQTHVKDLANNQPNQGDCNLHSWSSKGTWSSCCYTADHAQAACMWGKPGELTSYHGNGYEIACNSGDAAISAQKALQVWKSSSGHNAVILNQSIWKTSTWNAIGIGIYNGYAVVWFGAEPDK